MEEERTNSRVVSTNTPGLNMVFMARSKTIKKPRHQGKGEVTRVVKQKSSKQVYSRKRSRYVFISCPGATYKWRSER